EAWPGVTATRDNQSLAAASDVILLSVPPARAGEIGLRAEGRLVISVMAGITVAEIRRLTGADRVIRAMSSPAARLGLAYSPWFASPAVTLADRATATRLFAACGETDEVAEEGQIDVFTALTGPIPGFVAYFADCMASYAAGQGIDPAIADRAVRQLFRAAGAMLAGGSPTPADHVREMVDYAGTTAAGLRQMEASPLRQSIHDGLDAATRAARALGGPEG
ncbi:MAG: pyrroline-5-carboxylate reductase, partial [Paracoccaceae bacterium]|nr:pyrroline-5-carboxylate reductase [Paracoccaceae bacterium]